MPNDFALDPALIAPIISAAGVVLVALIAAIAGFRNVKRGAIETRAPDVNEIWGRAERREEALDGERKHRRLLEDFGHFMQDMFQAYVLRVQAGGSVELTTREREAHDAQVPEAPNVSEK